MKKKLPFLIGASLLFVLAVIAAWHNGHALSPRQQVLLAQMREADSDRNATLADREPLLADELHLARTAVSNQQWVAARQLAGATADETARLHTDVQTSEQRWRTAQTEFAALTSHRQNLAWAWSAVAVALLLVLGWSSSFSLPRWH